MIFSVVIIAADIRRNDQLGGEECFLPFSGGCTDNFSTFFTSGKRIICQDIFFSFSCFPLVFFASQFNQAILHMGGLTV
ncbi:MAG: hypothetical protein N2C12_08160, partial [Planctomycetales bacterium]